MRTVAIIFSLCLCSLSVKSQEWAPVGAAWHYTEAIFMPATIDIDYIKFESVKDTMYQGKPCRKITKRHNVSCTDRPMVEYMYSENDKVYFWDPNFNMFQVLYDFSAGAGDSWTILVDDPPHSDVDSLIVRVDSAGNTLINGVLLKRLYVTYDFRNETIIPDTYNGVIIQSVGDLYFMFNYFPEYLLACDGNFSGGLRCYEDGVIGLYETGIAESCTYVHYLTGIGSPQDNKPAFAISPNPARETITIESDLPGAFSYAIADMTGRILMSGRITGTATPTGGLTPGIYQVYFYRDGARIMGCKKLVIQR